jgi:Putative prokaryotic signal transducing protein
MSPIEIEREDDQKPDANEKLEQIFDTADETEALVVQGLLESNGIECMETTRDAPQDVLPGVGGIVLSVRQEQAAQARLMIEEYRNDAAQDQELDDAAVGAGDSKVNAEPK